MGHGPSGENTTPRDDQPLQAGTAVRREKLPSVTWYLSSSEWKHFRAELQHARDLWSRIQQGIKDHRRTLLRVRPHRQEELDRYERKEQALMEHAKSLDARIEEADSLDALAVVQKDIAQWKRERDEFIKVAITVRRIINDFHDMRKTGAHTDERFLRLKRVTELEQEYRDVMVRLQQREQILIDAITAGIYFTKPEVASLESLSGKHFVALVRKLSEVA